MRRKKFHVYFCVFLSWIKTLRPVWDLPSTTSFSTVLIIEMLDNFGTRYLYMATNDIGNSRREWERLGRRRANLLRRRKHFAENSLRCKPLTSSIYFPSNNHPFIFHEKKMRFDTSTFPIILLLSYTYIVAYMISQMREIQNLKEPEKTNFCKSK